MTLIVVSTLVLVHVIATCGWTTPKWFFSRPHPAYFRYPTRIGSIQDDNDTVGVVESTRRRHINFLTASGFLGIFVGPQTARAGEVGARITKAVTQSDLGVSVRRSVVRGAQIIDQVDGKWEQFSDRFGLGAERSKQGGRPKRKVIPDPQSLDSRMAQGILDISDNVFLSLTSVAPKELAERITKVEDLVRPSFERSGVTPPEKGDILKGDQFNFESYVHFRAYGDYMVESKKAFPPFYKEFTRQVGQQILSLLSRQKTTLTVETAVPSSKQASLEEALRLVDKLCATLVSNGFVASTERSAVDPDRLADWVEDIEDFQCSVALDGDITRGSQILLQEQGYRLYPNYGRFAVVSLLSSQLPDQKIVVDEYYMDTDYNSDPNLFEVKEVLLNIVVESQ